MNKWYAVPNHTDPSNTTPVSLRPATVVDQYGQQIAEFESLCDAEAAVAHFNARHDGLVTLPVKEAI
mgnify:CR=1 FL=1